LFLKCDYTNVALNLEELEEKKLISSNKGFYFLPGSENNVKVRLERYNYSYEKLKKIKAISRLLSFVPWLKLIAVGNNIGANNSRKESDIDILIITEKNRLWISRFFCVLIVAILRQRPSKKIVKDKICLSFLISESRMDLSPLLLGSMDNNEKKFNKLSEFPDPYFLYWLACLMPIYDPEEMYNKLINSNSWLSEHLPNLETITPIFVNIRKERNIIYRDIIDLFIGGLDGVMQKIQLKIFPKNIKKMLNIDKCVIANNDIIKLHTKDRRELFLNQYKLKLDGIIYKKIHNNIKK
jgi:hypothetical protein